MRPHPTVSVVLVVHDMAREAPRTLRSLAPEYQLGVESLDYEVIVLDNGSPEPLGEATVAAFGPRFRYVYVRDAHPSPVRAVNEVMATARGDVVGIAIDGARMLTPGVLRHAASAFAAFAEPVVVTPGFELGSERQPDAIHKGYDKGAEDALLERIGWPEDGYRLFEISVLTSSCAHGVFRPVAESNCLFMSRSLWNAIGGMDERFAAPGGGFANLDLYARAVTAPGVTPVMLLGEGTFHQLHGGVSMAAASPELDAKIAAWRAQYAEVVGTPYTVPRVAFEYVGHVPKPFLRVLSRSAEMRVEAEETKPPASPSSHGGRGATKTVILHIGFPKAGSSAVQWFMHTRRDELRAEDVYYPLSGLVEADHNHHKLALSLGSDAMRKALFDELSSEIDQCGCSTVVLSSELLLLRLELIQASDEFRRLLEGRQLRVLCVLRSQETFFESLYRQFILDPKVRFAGSPEAFLETYGALGDYHRPLSAWAHVVGNDNLVPMIYEQAVQSGGLIRGFCRLLGVDVSRLAGGDFDVRRNVSHDNAVMFEIVRMANGYPDLTDDQRMAVALHARTFGESTRELPLPQRLMAAEHLDRIHALFMDSNRRLAQEFVHQPLDGFWFPHTPPGEPARDL